MTPNIKEIIYAIVVIAIACGALGLAYHLIKKMIDGSLAEINKIKENYVEEEKHMLLCENNTLKVQKLFTDCFKKYQDAIFEKIRQGNEANERHIRSLEVKLTEKIETLQGD